MWRLNIRKMYLKKVFEVRKFFVNERHDFLKEDILLLQIVKEDEPGRLLGRIRGLLIFEDLIEDAEDESTKLYGIKWKYAIIPSKCIQFQSKDWFSLENVIGEEAKKVLWASRSS